jgi:4-diphosphocytidyl-2-C-methyl-D-erythritol kinase
MIVFPPAKINLGLNIIRKRTDGYHDLETAFYPVPVRDALEIIVDPAISESSSPLFTSSGLSVDGPQEDNICLRAYRLLKNDFPQLPPVRIHLHKVIPMGAGLGGGSSDGAATLALLNRLAGLNIAPGQLLVYALALGSDCPFFLEAKPCFATGRGEIMQPLPLDLTGYQLVLVNPGIHVSTAAAFRGIRPEVPGKSVSQILQQPIETWKAALKNDFELGIFQLHPEIGALKETLYNAGSIYASMSGSGSSVYGIFPGKARPVLDLPSPYRVFHVDL